MRHAVPTVAVSNLWLDETKAPSSSSSQWLRPALPFLKMCSLMLSLQVEAHNALANKRHLTFGKFTGARQLLADMPARTS
jgi:hypothetical protein